MSSSTTYRIFADDAERATKSKKAPAVELAMQLRHDERVDVRVETDKGTLVFEAKAPKKIKMSKPFTRVVGLPEGFEVPEGYRVAYTRSRKGVALVHNFEDEDGPYALFDYVGDKFLLKGLPTTRSAGQAVKALSL